MTAEETKVMVMQHGRSRDPAPRRMLAQPAKAERAQTDRPLSGCCKPAANFTGVDERKELLDSCRCSAAYGEQRGRSAGDAAQAVRQHPPKSQTDVTARLVHRL
jgi:hypothetical protein